MNYCTKCGSKLDESGKCPKCNNKKLKIIIPIITVIIVLVGIYIPLNKHFSNPELAITKFNEAIGSKNEGELQSILASDDSRITIDKDNTKVLLDYFQSNPSYVDNVKNILKSDANSIENGASAKNSAVFSLKEVGHKFLIFPEYKIVVKPSYIEVKTNIKDANIKVNGKEYKNVKENSEIGPLMPGNYVVLAEVNNKYIKKSENISVDLMTDQKKTINVFDNLKYINIQSDIPSAKLYVNGKDTGVSISDASNFGPVDDKSIIYAIGEKDGKKLRSSNYTVDSYSDNIYIDFSQAVKEDEDFKAQVYNLIRDYDSSFAYAVNNNDFNYIKDYLEPGSQIYNAQSKVIGSIYEKNIREDFISLDIKDLKFDKDKNEGSVSCSEVYDISKGYDNPKTRYFENVYKFIRKPDGQLVLTDISETKENK